MKNQTTILDARQTNMVGYTHEKYFAQIDFGRVMRGQNHLRLHSITITIIIIAGSGCSIDICGHFGTELIATLVGMANRFILIETQLIADTIMKAAFWESLSRCASVSICFPVCNGRSRFEWG